MLVGILLFAGPSYHYRCQDVYRWWQIQLVFHPRVLL